MNGLFLENVKIREDILDKFKEKDCLEIISKGFIKEQFPIFLNCVINYNLEQEKLFVNFSKYVDKTMRSTGIKNKNLFHKIPTIIAGGIYIGRFYDRIKDCDFLYLMNISRFSSFSLVKEFASNLELITEEIFEVYKEKDIDYLAFPIFNQIVENMTDNGKSREEIIDFIRSKSLVELVMIIDEYIADLSKKEGFYL